MSDDFIEESIAAVSDRGAGRVFDESMLRVPLSAIEPARPLVVEPQASVLEAVTVMVEGRVGVVLVSRGAKLKGIFTERDAVTKIVARGIDPAKTPVRKVMTPDPETLRPTDSIAYALNKMSLGGYRHVPLVDSARTPVGVVSVRDIVNYLVTFFPESVLNLPTLPRGNYAQQREGA